ncbi:hypothetical protein KIH74_28900 [Kineosporia sp. J2-2]|uniref:Uncharacterized protein n=1 Tax=Kineosporia corallincola TaxID=2835133 RepID=A0ABS5TPH3_9ACTN|nr:hypothetical protein [Kineosporia corallincola]MBT0772996.1 hypothetical protein [Kineosporia corallincola]
MKIDDTVEIAVREGFAASVAEEPDRFYAAIESVVDRGDDFTINAFQLTINVNSIILQDIHEGSLPELDEIADLAEDFAETQEDWSEVSAELAGTYMAAALSEQSVLEVMNPGDVATTGFALGGWLLSAFLPDDKEWTDYLDEVLQVLETALAEE